MSNPSLLEIAQQITESDIERERQERIAAKLAELQAKEEAERREAAVAAKLEAQRQAFADTSEAVRAQYAVVQKDLESLAATGVELKKRIAERDAAGLVIGIARPSNSWAAPERIISAALKPLLNHYRHTILPPQHVVASLTDLP